MKEVGHELNSAEKNLRKNHSLDFIITNNFIIFVPMTDTIAQIFGMTFVGVILICLVWTIMSYIFNNENTLEKRNKKLMDNMKKFK